MDLKELSTIADAYRDALWIRFQIETKIEKLIQVIDKENLPINKKTGTIDFELLKRSTDVKKADNADTITPLEKVVIKPQSTSALEQALKSTNAGK